MADSSDAVAPKPKALNKKIGTAKQGRWQNHPTSAVADKASLGLGGKEMMKNLGRTLLFAAIAALCGACASSSRYMGIDYSDAFVAADFCQGRRACYADLPNANLAYLASQGDKEAQFQLGLRFEEGVLLQQNHRRAQTLYQHAASDTFATSTIYVPTGDGLAAETVSAGIERRGLEQAAKRLAEMSTGGNRQDPSLDGGSGGKVRSADAVAVNSDDIVRGASSALIPLIKSEHFSYECLYLPYANKSDLIRNENVEAINRIIYARVRESDACFEALKLPHDCREYSESILRVFDYLIRIRKNANAGRSFQNWRQCIELQTTRRGNEASSASPPTGLEFLQFEEGLLSPADRQRVASHLKSDEKFMGPGVVAWSYWRLKCGASFESPLHSPLSALICTDKPLRADDLFRFLETKKYVEDD